MPEAGTTPAVFDTLDDERAIEGLPIRLVIALVVGVASLSVMMNMVSGISAIGVSELDVQPEPEVVAHGEIDEVSVTVVGPDGDRIAGATVVARGDSAMLDGVATATTDTDGVATLDIDPSLGQNQADGTVSFEVKPPANSEYVDRRENTVLLVTRS
ncbi:Ig domain-containing protein group 1 domain-containing protein [Halobacteriales archaeon SW_8_65_20]|nr:MAG: Ig domain-containing protein group 1 domain-containing protein [Halobacteriales archaeon SW_8_65_20]